MKFCVYLAPEGSTPSFVGSAPSLRSARSLIARHGRGEIGALPADLWETARQAGHCGGLAAPEGEDREPVLWSGKGWIRDQAIARAEKEMAALLRSLKPQIADDYRATDEPGDNTPAMQVTFGVTVEGETVRWDYQTGDNSYSGGAYCHRNWGIVTLTRRANCRGLAADAMGQALEGALA